MIGDGARNPPMTLETHPRAASSELRKGILLRLVVAGLVLGGLLLASLTLERERPPVDVASPAATGAKAVDSAAANAGSTTSAVFPVTASGTDASGAAGEVKPAATVDTDKTTPDALPAAQSADVAHTSGKASAGTGATAQEGRAGVPVAPAPPLPDPASEKPRIPAGSYLQVGVFIHPENAAELKRKLEAQGIPVHLATRVQVGPFKDKKEAERVRAKLKALGMQSIPIAQ